MIYYFVNYTNLDPGTTKENKGTEIRIYHFLIFD